MKVNMTPNPLDVVTIHASQGDTEARQWEFELHNNGELIDTSEITEQLFFKSYKGGTEEILPENGSVPTTSPIIADIKYPQGLLSDQEFLYRESPTEEDGQAKIRDIRGNTLVWNQLVNNGNFESVGDWEGLSLTLTVSNNKATLVTSTTSAALVNRTSGVVLPANHKGLLMVKSDNTVPFRARLYNSTWVTLISQSMTKVGNIDYILLNLNDTTKYLYLYPDRSAGDTITVEIIQLFDLTQMGLDITDPSDFTSLFSLPYYAYNQGTLLSFMGNGIKTVSKNQFDTSVVTTSYAGMALTKTQGTIRAVYSGGSQYAGFNFYGSPVFTDTFLKGKYRLSFDVSGLDTQWTVGLRRGASFLGGGQALAISNDGHYSFTIDAGANPNCYLSFARTGNKTTAYDVTFSNIQLELGTNETSYEPYTSSTLSLPISTYFPNGMDGVGTDYDELTNTKATTRMTRVNLGSFDWSYNEQYQCFITYPVLTDSADVNTTSVPNFKSIYKAVSWGVGATDATQDMIVCFLSSAHQLRIRNKSFADATAFKNSLQGVYLVYPLATPTEVTFSTASLVTENAEIPLSNEDGVLIGKCTEQLSENPGFIDAKIKLTDSDGTCYSNKIQLHVERSPQ